MSSEYSLSLKATLDTSEVEQKMKSIGTSGTASFQGIENAVKRLEAAIAKLDNSVQKTAADTQKAARATSSGNINSRALLRMGAGVVGGQILGNVADQAAAAGNTNLAVGARAGQGALQGAAMGAMFGPAGIAIGATVGALNSAFAELAASAQRASDSLMKSVVAQQKNIVDWRARVATTAQNIEYRGLDLESAEQLEARVEAARKARQAYEEFTTPGSEAASKWTEETKDAENWTALREQHAKELEDEMKRAGALGSRAEQLLKARQPKTQSLSQFIAPTSNLASTGRDVGGYGGFRSMEQQAIAEAVNQTRKIEQQTTETKAVHDISLNIYNLLMRHFMNISSAGQSASWQ